LKNFHLALAFVTPGLSYSFLDHNAPLLCGKL